MLLMFGGAGTAAVNAAPVVNAGPDGNSTTGSAYGLSGSVTDDGLPSGTLTSTWSQVSGPGVAVFSNTASPTSTVTCPVVGTYVFRLTGFDTSLTTTDDVTITVSDPPSAGNDGMDVPWVRTNWM